MNEMSAALEAVLFAAGDSVPLARLSLIMGINEEELLLHAHELRDGYIKEGRGIRLLELDGKLQLCSAPEHAALVSKILEQRKPQSLSQSALEALAVVAYFQPVTRAYVDGARGVDSSYTMGVLQERGLIEECGRLEVPGRPALFRTTDAFLRTMGVSKLSELPVLPEVQSAEGMDKLKKAIDNLRSSQSEGQMSLNEVTGKAKEG